MLSIHLDDDDEEEDINSNKFRQFKSSFLNNKITIVLFNCRGQDEEF